MNEIQEVIRDTDNTINSTKEILYNIKTLRVLGEIKRRVQEMIEMSNPCLSCDEFEYCQQKGALSAFEECLDMINEQINILKND